MKTSIAIALLFVLSFFANADAETAKAVVSQGKTVKANYILTVDGKVFDRSAVGKPLEFKLGDKKMIPGFEKGVMGMAVGQKKTFTVKPEEGYGKADPKKKIEVPLAQLPPKTKPGMTIYHNDTATNQSTRVKVVEVKNGKAVIDMNHILAGKTLKFDVEIVEIR